MYTKGKHSQVIYFENGSKRFVHNVIDAEEATMIHLLCENGIEVIVNKSKVNYTVCIPADKGTYNTTDALKKVIESNE